MNSLDRACGTVQIGPISEESWDFKAVFHPCFTARLPNEFPRQKRVSLGQSPEEKTVDGKVLICDKDIAHEKRKEPNMKTKALLAAGLMMAASAASSLAQTVYSVNVVGFINIVSPPGFSMVANQLNNSGVNTIASIFPTPPAGSKVFKFNGSGFDTYEYFTGLGWFPNGNATLNPGEGCFFKNPTASAITTTVVGSITGGAVQLNSGFTIASSIIPQQGLVTADLRVPTADGDKIFRFNNANNGYDVFQYFALLGGWFPSEPSINIGESFFVSKVSGTQWSRTFSAETGPN